MSLVGCGVVAIYGQSYSTYIEVVIVVGALTGSMAGTAAVENGSGSQQINI